MHMRIALSSTMPVLHTDPCWYFANNPNQLIFKKEASESQVVSPYAFTMNIFYSLVHSLNLFGILSLVVTVVSMLGQTHCGRESIIWHHHILQGRFWFMEEWWYMLWCGLFGLREIIESLKTFRDVGEVWNRVIRVHLGGGVLGISICIWKGIVLKIVVWGLYNVHLALVVLTCSLLQ